MDRPPHPYVFGCATELGGATLFQEEGSVLASGCECQRIKLWESVPMLDSLALANPCEYRPLLLEQGHIYNTSKHFRRRRCGGKPKPCLSEVWGCLRTHNCQQSWVVMVILITTLMVISRWSLIGGGSSRLAASARALMAAFF